MTLGCCGVRQNDITSSIKKYFPQEVNKLISTTPTLNTLLSLLSHRRVLWMCVLWCSSQKVWESRVKEVVEFVKSIPGFQNLSKDCSFMKIDHPNWSPRVNTHTHTHAHTHTHTRARARAHARTHTHTHTQVGVTRPEGCYVWYWKCILMALLLQLLRSFQCRTCTCNNIFTLWYCYCNQWDWERVRLIAPPLSAQHIR